MGKEYTEWEYICRENTYKKRTSEEKTRMERMNNAE